MVEGSISGREHFGQPGAHAVKGGDAHRDGDVDVRSGLIVVVYGNKQVADVDTQTFSDVERVNLACVREQNGELLTTEASGQVIDTQLAL